MATMKIYVVYANPPDYRNKVAVRRWCMPGPVPCTDLLIVADTLDEARDVIRTLSPETVRVLEDDPNEPHIVEAWI